MKTKNIKQHLLQKWAENLIEFWYSNATPENILTDEIYKEFFKWMLEENKWANETIDTVIDELLQQIDSVQPLSLEKET